MALQVNLSDPNEAKVTSAHLGQHLGVPEPDAPQGPLEEPDEDRMPRIDE